jgi:hypothetical protein
MYRAQHLAARVASRIETSAAGDAVLYVRRRRLLPGEAQAMEMKRDTERFTAVRLRLPDARAIRPEHSPEGRIIAPFQRRGQHAAARRRIEHCGVILPACAAY